MEKLTRILAVAERIDDGAALLAKSVAVARRFGARVELLVVDPVHPRALTDVCRSNGYDDVLVSSLHRADETIPELILRRVQSTQPDLLVKLPAHCDRGPLHESDWQLARECPVPVLLARSRAWRDPTRFAVAVDVTDSARLRLARGTLHTAGFLALGLRGSLDVLYSERETSDEALRMERAVKVAQLVREFHVGCERIQMFSGTPETRLPPLIAARHYDVVVIGLEPDTDSRAHDALLARRVADAAGGDLVLLRATAGDEERIAAWRRASDRQQLLHEAQ